jgi:phosphoenolpyruvate carboxylase
MKILSFIFWEFQFVIIMFVVCSLQIQACFRTDEIRRAQPTPQDEMRYGMSYFHETIWKGVPKFLRRVDTALKNIGIDERFPYNAPLIKFSSWMGGDRDGKSSFTDANDLLIPKTFCGNGLSINSFNLP